MTEKNNKLSSELNQLTLVNAMLNDELDYNVIRTTLQHLDCLDSVFLILSADQKITYINNAGCAILKQKHEDIIGKNWFDNYIPTVIRETLKARFSDLMKGKLSDYGNYENEILINQNITINMCWDNSLIKNPINNAIIGSFSLGKKKERHISTRLTESNLTKRELEVLRFFAMGYNPKEVSQRLSVQPKTIHAHKANLFQKLGFNNQRELLSFALLNNLIKLDDLLFD